MFNLSQTLFPSRENPTTSVFRVGIEERALGDEAGEGKAEVSEKASVAKIRRIRRAIGNRTDQDL